MKTRWAYGILMFAIVAYAAVDGGPKAMGVSTLGQIFGGQPEVKENCNGTETANVWCPEYTDCIFTTYAKIRTPTSGETLSDLFKPGANPCGIAEFCYRASYYKVEPRNCTAVTISE